MLYAKGSSLFSASGHIGDEFLSSMLHENYLDVTTIQADGDELARACALLGRNMPPVKVYKFIGENAKEIALNW